MARVRNRRRPIAEINVVPYIDVMLVLLVIFMITAPLLAQGVKVDLPQEAAEPLKPDELEPLVVTVDVKGQLSINFGDQRNRPLEPQVIRAQVEKVLKHAPQRQVMVRGDKAAEYRHVMRAMVLLQQAGAPSVGLMADPLE